MGKKISFGDRGFLYFRASEIRLANRIVAIFKEQNCSLNMSAIRRLCMQKYGYSPGKVRTTKILLMMTLSKTLKIGQYGRSRNFRLNTRPLQRGRKKVLPPSDEIDE